MILRKVQFVISHFNQAWWLPGGHLQTIWSNLRKRKISIPLVRERLNLPDGDFLDLDWTQFEEKAPIVLVLHGLEGSISSNYAKGMLAALKCLGLNGVFMHFRGCSGEDNKSVRSYHPGETNDLDYVLQILKQRHPFKPIGAIGFSLGGNVLLKYLGETQIDNPVSCAVAISVPFLLNRFSDKIQIGLSSVYQKYFLCLLKKKIIRKARNINLPIDVKQIDSIYNFWDFDNLITAKLNGFKDAKDYYRKSSSFYYLSKIKQKTLIIHAENDPFLPLDAIPDKGQLPKNVQFKLYQGGGHVGFITGNLPWNPKYWLEEQLPSYMYANLVDKS